MIGRRPFAVTLCRGARLKSAAESVTAKLAISRENCYGSGAVAVFFVTGPAGIHSMDDPVRPDPEELLRQARAGSSPALGELLELYRSYLALLARVQIGQRLQGKVDAADLVQDAFLEAHRHFAQFRGTAEGELVSWLRQILAGVLANLVRRFCRTRRRD